MANLKEEAKWEEGIYQYELDDPLQGGEDGIDNVQGRQLANRTSYLREKFYYIGRKLNDHIYNTKNPHEITAEQIGTYTKKEIDVKIGDSYNWALVDERYARNLLDVFGIRAVHSDEPATHAEVKKVMELLHIKMVANEIPDFSGLRLCDYLDLPEINDGTTTYKWNSKYKNLRIMIAAFNPEQIAIPTNDAFSNHIKGHILFTFRHCVFKREVNKDFPLLGKYSELEAYLNGSFKSGLEAVIGEGRIYAFYRNVSRGSFTSSSPYYVFLPTEREVWGDRFNGISRYDAECYQQQIPIFRDSRVYRIKYFNGESTTWALSSVAEDNRFCCCLYDGLPKILEGQGASGISPMFYFY